MERGIEVVGCFLLFGRRHVAKAMNFGRSEQPDAAQIRNLAEVLLRWEANRSMTTSGAWCSAAISETTLPLCERSCIPCKFRGFLQKQSSMDTLSESRAEPDLYAVFSLAP